MEHVNNEVKKKAEDKIMEFVKQKNFKKGSSETAAISFYGYCKTYLDEKEKDKNAHKKSLANAIIAIFNQLENKKSLERILAIKVQIIINVFSYSTIMIKSEEKEKGKGEDKFSQYTKESYLNFSNEGSSTRKRASSVVKVLSTKIKVNEVGDFLSNVLKLLEPLDATSSIQGSKKIKKNIATELFNQRIEDLRNIMPEYSFSRMEKIFLEFLGQAFYHFMRKGDKFNVTADKIKALTNLCAQIAIALSAETITFNSIVNIITHINLCIISSRSGGSGEEAVTLEKITSSFRDKIISELTATGSRKNIHDKIDINNEGWKSLLPLVSEHSTSPYTHAVLTKIYQKPRDYVWAETDTQEELSEKLKLLKDILSPAILKSENKLRPFDQTAYLMAHAQQIAHTLKYLHTNIHLLNKEQKLKLGDYIKIFNTFINQNITEPKKKKELFVSETPLPIKHQFDKLTQAIKKSNPAGYFYQIMNQIYCTQKYLLPTEFKAFTLNVLFENKLLIAELISFGFRYFDDIAKDYSNLSEVVAAVKELYDWKAEKSNFDPKDLDYLKLIRNIQELKILTDFDTCLKILNSLLEKFAVFLPQEYKPLSKKPDKIWQDNLDPFDWNFQSSPSLPLWNIHTDGNIWPMKGPNSNEDLGKIFAQIFALPLQERPWAIKALGKQDHDFAEYPSQDFNIYDDKQGIVFSVKVRNGKYGLTYQVIQNSYTVEKIVNPETQKAEMRRTNYKHMDETEIVIYNKITGDNQPFNNGPLEREQDEFILKHSLEIGRPVLVHCASGVGRTGTDNVISKGREFNMALLALLSNHNAQKILRNLIDPIAQIPAFDFTKVAQFFAPFNITQDNINKRKIRDIAIKIILAYDYYQSAIATLVQGKNLSAQQIEGFNTIVTQLLHARRGIRYAVQVDPQMDCLSKEIIMDYAKNNLELSQLELALVDSDIVLADTITPYVEGFEVPIRVLGTENKGEMRSDKGLAQLIGVTKGNPIIQKSDKVGLPTLDSTENKEGRKENEITP